MKSQIQNKNGNFENSKQLFYEDMDAFNEESLVPKRIEQVFYKKRSKILG